MQTLHSYAVSWSVSPNSVENIISLKIVLRIVLREAWPLRLRYKLITNIISPYKVNILKEPSCDTEPKQ